MFYLILAIDTREKRELRTKYEDNSRTLRYSIPTALILGSFHSIPTYVVNKTFYNL
jgi:hypothetical protein